MVLILIFLLLVITVPLFKQFLFKQKLTGKTVVSGTKDVETMVSLKNLSNFLKILEILVFLNQILESLINYETNLILTWSSKCFCSNDAKTTTFKITDTKLYIPVVALLKILQQLNPCFNRIVTWNKYQ